MKKPRRLVVLPTLALLLWLGVPLLAQADVTPTPAVQPTLAATTGAGGDEACSQQLLINITGCPPADLTISGWTAYTANNYDAPTGSKRFEKPWEGQAIAVSFEQAVSYRLFGWSDADGWVYLTDFSAAACGDQQVTYDFACTATAAVAATTPAATLTATPTVTATTTLAATATATLAATATPTGTPLAELPQTGGQGGLGWWPWVLAGGVLGLAGLRWRQLFKLTH